MKTTLLICTILAVAFSSRAAPLPPADSFRLTVEEVVQSSGCRVVNIKITTRAAEMMQMSWDNGVRMSSNLSPAFKGKAREGTVVLASMLGEGFTVCHTSTTVQSSILPVSYDLAPGMKFESVVSLSVTNGIYKLDRPLVVGTRNGETMRLVVGKWNQVSQNK